MERVERPTSREKPSTSSSTGRPRWRCRRQSESPWMLSFVRLSLVMPPGPAVSVVRSGVANAGALITSSVNQLRAFARRIRLCSLSHSQMQSNRELPRADLSRHVPLWKSASCPSRRGRISVVIWSSHPFGGNHAQNALPSFPGTRKTVALSATVFSEPTGATSETDRPASPAISSQPGFARGIGEAPVGHRQPTLRDAPKNENTEIDAQDKTDREFDRILNICRGC